MAFGGAGVSQPLSNWVLHVRQLGIAYVVACMDDPLFELAQGSGYPAVLMAPAAGRAGEVRTRWKYYRMDPKAFLAMGILKVRFLMELLTHLLTYVLTD